MGKMGPASIRTTNLNKLFITFICTLWISITPVVFAVHRASKAELGQSLVDSSRESLLVGDNRTAMIIFGKGVPKWFSSVRVEKANGSEVFEVPGANTFNVHLTIPIWLTEDTTPYGYAKLTYPLSNLLPTIISWFLISTVIIFALFKREKNRLLKDISTQNQVLHLEAENNLARQVSHDIRSPLSAISMLTGVADLNSSEARDLLKNAALRIRDIAQDLLERSKRSYDKQFELQPIKIDEVIKAIIREKKIEYHEKKGLSFEVMLNCSDKAVLTNKTEISRVLSNLINNSVEAQVNPTLDIRVSTSSVDNFIEVDISDDGSGVPVHILNDLGKKMVTFGKEGVTSGSGQGVFHANEVVVKSGGKFSIESSVGKGTSIKIRLPVTS